MMPAPVATRSKAWVCGCSLVGIAGSNPAWVCLLLDRGICDEMITRPEESYRVWCVVMCDREASTLTRPVHWWLSSLGGISTSLWHTTHSAFRSFLLTVTNQQLLLKLTYPIGAAGICRPV